MGVPHSRVVVVSPLTAPTAEALAGTGSSKKHQTAAASLALAVEEEELGHLGKNSHLQSYLLRMHDDATSLRLFAKGGNGGNGGNGGHGGDGGSGVPGQDALPSIVDRDISAKKGVYKHNFIFLLFFLALIQYI